MCAAPLLVESAEETIGMKNSTTARTKPTHEPHITSTSWRVPPLLVLSPEGTSFDRELANSAPLPGVL